MTDQIPNAELLLAVGSCTLWRDSDNKLVALASNGHSDYLLVLPEMKRVLYDRPEAFTKAFLRAVLDYVFPPVVTNKDAR